LYGFLIFGIIIIGLLIVNEFILFPFFPISSSTSSADCDIPNLQRNIDYAEIILVGMAGSSKWRPYSFYYYPIDWETGEPTGEKIKKTNVKTDTIIKIDEIVFGDYDKEKIIAYNDGGCHVRLNYCMTRSVTAIPQKGETYLLFLSNPDDTGAYGGFSSCGGIYKVDLDNNGNQIVDCRFNDIADFEECAGQKILLEDLILIIKEKLQ